MGSRTNLQSLWFRFARAFRRSLTPLDWAAAFGRAAVAELLLAKGADVNAERMTGCGRSHGCVPFSARARGLCGRVPRRVGHRRRDLAIFVKHPSIDSINQMFLFQSSISRFIANLATLCPSIYSSVCCLCTHF